MMNPFAVAPFTVGGLTALLGLAVLIRERGTFVSVMFWLMTWTGAAWLVSYAGIYSAPNAPAAVWWARAENVAVVFIPSMVYIFTLSVVQRFRELQRFAWASIAVSALFMSCVLWGNLFIGGVYRYSWGYYPKYGPVGVLFLFYFALMIGSGLRLYWSEYQRTRSALQKQRLRELLAAIGIATVGSMDFFPALGIRIYPMGYLPVLAFVVLVARAIWKYRLVDLTPAFAAEQILKTMADALLVLDLEVNIRVVNESAARLFALSPKELIGKPLWAVGAGFFTKEKLDRLLRTGTIQGYETTFLTREGNPLLLDISTSLIRDKAGEPVGIVCIARDLSERHPSTESLRDS